MTTTTTPARMFPTASEALASGDNRKMFEMRFKGVDGTIFVIASTEHQAKQAMLDNVVTVSKINAAERSKMLQVAFAEMMKLPRQKALPGTEPEPPTEKADAPTDHDPARTPDEAGAPDARSSVSEPSPSY